MSTGKEVQRRFARFLVVGGTATALNYGVYLILMKQGLSYLPASAVGYVSGIVLSYFLNKAWAFSASSDSHQKVLPFLVVYTVNLVSAQVLLWLLVSKVGVSAGLANIPALGYTTMANFVGLHFFVFRARAA